MARGSIRKRGSTWTAIYYVDGKQKWKGGFKRRMDAEAFLDEVNGQMRDGTYMDMPDISFEEFAEQFLSGHKARVRASTLEKYRTHCRLQLIPYFGKYTLKSIRPLDIERFLARLNDSGLGATTQKGYLITLKMLLRKACELGYLTKSPAEFTKPPRVVRVEMQVLDPEQIALLIKHTDERYKVLMMAACYTGLRQAELLGLCWDCVDFNCGLIYVKRTQRDGKFSEVKTDSSLRSVPMPPALIQALKEHQIRQLVELPQNEHNLVFTTTAGTPLNHSNLIKRVLMPALARAGLSAVRWHDLRHSYASILLSSGEPIKYVSSLLGHSTANVTLGTYSHVMPATKADADERIGSIFTPETAPV